MKPSINRLLGCAAIIFALCLLASPAAHSKELYVAYANTSDNFYLGKIDYSDPETVQTIGFIGRKLIRALEFAGDGKLYAYENLLWGSSQLYEVDPDTAALTPIGPAGSQRIDGMAYNPIDGKMYGVEATFTSGKLYTIDLATGALTFEGNIHENGPVSGRSWIAGLGVDSSGFFYAYNNAGDIGNPEQGLYRSTQPGGLNFEWVYDLNDEFGFPNNNGNLQTPAPLFVDWSSDDRGYGWLREWIGGQNTGWYGYDWNDQGLSWTRYPLYPSQNKVFYAWTAPPTAGLPVPDVKVNGDDGPLYLTPNDNITVAIHLDPGSLDGEYADWWVYAERDASTMWWAKYRSGQKPKWTKIGTPIRFAGATLRTVNGYTVLGPRTLPAGNWVFGFAVDDKDGTYQGTYADTVEVNVN